jgi:hypothetical protein
MDNIQNCDSYIHIPSSLLRIHVAQDRDYWCAVVTLVLNLETWCLSDCCPVKEEPKKPKKLLNILCMCSSHFIIIIISFWMLLLSTSLPVGGISWDFICKEMLKMYSECAAIDIDIWYLFSDCISLPYVYVELLISPPGKQSYQWSTVVQ